MRHPRLIAAVAAAAVAAAVLVAVTTSATASPAAKKLTVGLVAVNLNSPSITRIKDAFVRSAKARGWTVKVFDGRGDQAATNNAAMGFIQRHVSAVVNDASPNNQMTNVIKAAHSKKIPFISIYGGYVPGVDLEIGTNEFINASLVTQWMVDHMHGKGKVIKENWTVLQALRDRDHAFDAVMQDQKGIDVVKKIEIKVPGQVQDAYQQTLATLRSNRDVNAVWIGWDELAPPVVRAIKQLHLDKKVFVVGFDGNPFAWDLIRSGSPYKIEPANPFEPMGERAVTAVSDIVAGKKPADPEVFMRPCVITQKTVPPAGKFPDWKTCPYFTGEIR
jgi:ribose transport system substrate-binding protein